MPTIGYIIVFGLREGVGIVNIVFFLEWEEFEVGRRICEGGLVGVGLMWGMNGRFCICAT